MNATIVPQIIEGGFEVSIPSVHARMGAEAELVLADRSIAMTPKRDFSGFDCKVSSAEVRKLPQVVPWICRATTKMGFTRVLGVGTARRAP